MESDAVLRSISPQRSLSTQRLFDYFSRRSAISAVKSYVSFLIRMAAFQASSGARMRLRLAGKVNRCKVQHLSSNIDELITATYFEA
jgi:hypothetical protein